MIEYLSMLNAEGPREQLSPEGEQRRRALTNLLDALVDPHVDNRTPAQGGPVRDRVGLRQYRTRREALREIGKAARDGLLLIGAGATFFGARREIQNLQNINDDVRKEPLAEDKAESLVNGWIQEVVMTPTNQKSLYQSSPTVYAVASEHQDVFATNPALWAIEGQLNSTVLGNADDTQILASGKVVDHLSVTVNSNLLTNPIANLIRRAANTLNPLNEDYNDAYYAIVRDSANRLALFVNLDPTKRPTGATAQNGLEYLGMMFNINDMVKATKVYDPKMRTWFRDNKWFTTLETPETRRDIDPGQPERPESIDETREIIEEFLDKNNVAADVSVMYYPYYAIDTDMSGNPSTPWYWINVKFDERATPQQDLVTVRTHTPGSSGNLYKDIRIPAPLGALIENCINRKSASLAASEIADIVGIASATNHDLYFDGRSNRPNVDMLRGNKAQNSMVGIMVNNQPIAATDYNAEAFAFPLITL